MLVSNYESLNLQAIMQDNIQEISQNQGGNGQDVMRSEEAQYEDNEERSNPSSFVSYHSTMASPTKPQEPDESQMFKFSSKIRHEFRAKLENDAKIMQTNFEKLKIQDKEKIVDFDVLDQIKRGLKGDFDLESDPSKRTKGKKKGRPEEIKDSSLEVLQKINEIFFNHLVKIANNVQRSDAKTTSIYREIKNYGYYGLQKLASKCQYTDNRVSVYNRSYIMCFVNHFCKSLKIPKKKISVELYLEYLTLKFPKKKVIGILDELEKHPVVSASLPNIRELFKIRTAASKANFCNYYETSECFRMVCKKVAKMAR
jgi:hypothetical protein